jgi:2-polyprenyl-6-methoxyphenol hydroxylase-like FAD-dependent oxidoreductase
VQAGEATVRVATDAGEMVHRARLVVAADGRNSRASRAAGFQVQRGPDRLQAAGVLFDGLQSPEDTIETWRNSWEDKTSGLFVVLFPQGGKRVRAYIAYSVAAPFTLSGPSNIPRFVQLFMQAGAPSHYFDGAQAVGPLACYSCTHLWVDHPYRNGVALIGDAAATTDPTHGQGMSMALRDVRVLRDCLLAHANWEEAGHAYATEHDGYFQIVATYETWANELWYSTGPQAVARRQRVQAAWKADPSRSLDINMSGPNAPLDEEARRRYFAEA